MVFAIRRELTQQRVPWIDQDKTMEEVGLPGCLAAGSGTEGCENATWTLGKAIEFRVINWGKLIHFIPFFV